MTFEVTTLAGHTSECGNCYGMGVAARFNNLMGITMRRDRILVVADSENDRLCTITTPDGQVAAVPHERLANPSGVLIDRDGFNIWVTDRGRLLHITPTGHTTIVAGAAGNISFSLGHRDASGDDVLFAWSHQCAMNPATGVIYIADLQCVRQVDVRPHELKTIRAIGLVPSLFAFPPVSYHWSFRFCLSWERFTPFAAIPMRLLDTLGLVFHLEKVIQRAHVMWN